MSKDAWGTKCPRCGHQWDDPDWCCPKCYYEFEGRSGRREATEASSVEDAVAADSVLDLDDCGDLLADPAVQAVNDPSRATQKFPSEGVWLGVGRILNLTALPLGGILSLIVGSVDKDQTFITIGYVSLGIGGAILVFGGMDHLGKGFDTINAALKPPKRNTPEDTLTTFFYAISDSQKFWRRAYNCLTDTAQNRGKMALPKDDYLQKLMPDADISSLETFKAFWEDLKFSRAPDLGNMHRKDIDSQTAEMRITIQARWVHTEQGTQEERKEDIPCRFLLVKRGEYWFMADGFFWPRGRKYTEGTPATG